MTTHCEKRAAAILFPGDDLGETLDKPLYELQVPGLPNVQFKSVRSIPDDKYLGIQDAPSWEDGLETLRGTARDEILPAFAVPPSIVDVDISPFSMYEHYIDRKTKKLLTGFAGDIRSCLICDSEKENE